MQGSANPCPLVKGLHDAGTQSRAPRMVEAYDCRDTPSCAASHLGAFSRYVLLQYSHSAQSEPNFTNPFRGASKAMKLCFSVMCDQWSNSLKTLRQPDEGFSHYLPVLPQCPAKSISSCAKHSSFTRTGLFRKVRFLPEVTICDAESPPIVVLLDLDQFHVWPGKTWQLRKQTRSHALAYPCKVSRTCQLLDSCVDGHLPEEQVPELSMSQSSQEPLSTSAVLIRDRFIPCLTPSSLLERCGPRIALGDITNISQPCDKPSDASFLKSTDEDVVSFMQKIAPKSLACKQSPFPDDGNPILEGVAQGQADPVPIESHTPSNDAMSDGYSASVATDSSQVAPPSSAGGRQESILYHLADPPIRVFLDWSDYDTMIQEIAFHLGRDPVEVIDAYEVFPYPHDTPEGATPIIVHIFDDIAVGQPAKLVLLDTELHGHSFEVNYVAGPTTTRTVVRLPERCTRSSVLISANVDLYCRQEADVCFVWHGQTRWADNDHQPRTISHGEYFRVAVPPTSRFTCSTVEAVALSQQGLSDQELLDQMTEQEVGLNLSPSLLSSEGVRNLARDESPFEDDEVFQALQERLVLTDISFQPAIDEGGISSDQSEVAPAVMLSALRKVLICQSATLRRPSSISTQKLRFLYLVLPQMILTICTSTPSPLNG